MVGDVTSLFPNAPGALGEHSSYWAGIRIGQERLQVSDLPFAVATWVLLALGGILIVTAAADFPDALYLSNYGPDIIYTHPWHIPVAVMYAFGGTAALMYLIPPTDKRARPLRVVGFLVVAIPWVLLLAPALTWFVIHITTSLGGFLADAGG